MDATDPWTPLDPSLVMRGELGLGVWQGGTHLHLLAGSGVTGPAHSSDATSFDGMLNLLSFRRDILIFFYFSILLSPHRTRTGKGAKFLVSRDFRNFARETQKKSTRV